MKAAYILPSIFAIVVLGGPTKRTCGEQCFNSTNGCGVGFGGCWDDCALGINERPTFVAPPCSVTSPLLRSAELDTASIVATTTPPHITPAPAAVSAVGESGCWSGHTICIDYIQSCGNGSFMYGGCDDVCSSKVYTAPPCTLPPVTATRASAKTKTKTKKPITTRPACDKAKSFMCAPLNWRL